MENQAKKTTIYPEYPQYFCRKCRALAREAKRFYKFSKKIDEPKIECPICGLTYIYTEDFSREQFGEYLTAIGCSINIDDVEEQRAGLPQWLESIENTSETGPRIVTDLLEELVPHARAFIHLTLSRLTPSAFRMLAGAEGNVAVRVMCLSADEEVHREARNTGRKQNLLEIKFTKGTSTVIPEEKILVVDGLVAITGNTGTGGEGTHFGTEIWENVRADAEPARIISLNNRLFSPLWGAMSGIGERIFMDPA